MPPIHGSKARMFLSGWDVSTSMRGASSPSSVDVADSSTWGMTSKRYTPSDRVDGSMTGEGVWEAFGVGSPGSIDELLHTSLGGLHVATHLPGGDGFGNRARIIGGSETSFEVDSPGDDVVGFSFELEANVGVANRARVLQPLAGALNVTVTGNGTSLDDLGAAGTTTKGLGAALHVINKGGGAGTLTVKVQHSPDNSVWTDLVTFTGRTAKNLAEYIEVSGTVQRWLRAIWTVTGGTWDFHVAAGRK
jgi:hypothetical protein